MARIVKYWGNELVQLRYHYRTFAASVRRLFNEPAIVEHMFSFQICADMNHAVLVAAIPRVSADRDTDTKAFASHAHAVWSADEFDAARTAARAVVAEFPDVTALANGLPYCADYAERWGAERPCKLEIVARGEISPALRHRLLDVGYHAPSPNAEIPTWRWYDPSERW